MKLIELQNLNSQSVAAGGKVALGSVDKSVNQCAYTYNGSNTITLRQNGYYAVLFKGDATSTAATQSMQITAVGNGVESEAGEGTAYATTSGETKTISFFKIVKVCGSALNLNFINSGAATTTLDNVLVSIVKIA